MAVENDGDAHAPQPGDLMTRHFITAISLWTLVGSASQASAEPSQRIPLWPGKPPGEVKALPPETDLAKPGDKPVGGRSIIRLANVSTPDLAIYRPSKEIDTGAAVIICPGGGHSILAYNHEGTEVAEWLTKQGVTGIVLKYRVPARDKEKRWAAAVQDGQRAVRLVRHHAAKWAVHPQRIGILGFSAGGETAALTTLLHEEPQYAPIDEADRASARPDFAVLIYPAGLVEKDNTRLKSYVRPSKETPPMFLVHAFDDRVDPRNSLLLAAGLKAVGVPCELHLYATGGHGFGIRDTGHPCCTWPARCAQWMAQMGFLRK